MTTNTNTNSEYKKSVIEQICKVFKTQNKTYNVCPMTSNTIAKKINVPRGYVNFALITSPDFFEIANPIEAGSSKWYYTLKARHAKNTTNYLRKLTRLWKLKQPQQETQ
jgi:hypothetical protein